MGQLRRLVVLALSCLALVLNTSCDAASFQLRGEAPVAPPAGSMQLPVHNVGAMSGIGVATPACASCDCNQRFCRPQSAHTKT